MPYHLAIPHRYGNKSSFMLYKVLSALRMKFMSDSFQHFVSSSYGLLFSKLRFEKVMVTPTGFEPVIPP